MVSAAAGATGTIVCQLARNVLGIERIVGIAGSEEKCDFLRNVLKVDVALNYNSPDYIEKFTEATPNYIDLCVPPQLFPLPQPPGSVQPAGLRLPQNEPC